MSFLIDTHAFLWWCAESSKLPERVRQVIETGPDTIFLSLASVWEIQIKHQLGKISLDKPLREIIDRELEDNFLSLAIQIDHILRLETLPHYHRDPFDRLLIAQATSEGLHIITKDPRFRHYGAPIFWE